MRRFLAAVLVLIFSATAHADPANDGISEDGAAFIGMVIANPWQGAYSIVQLWNPPDSGKILYLDQLKWAHSISGPSGCDIRDYIVPVGTVREHPFNKKLGGPVSVAETRWGNIHASELIGNILYECWSYYPKNDKNIVFDPAIIIPPGHGIVVVGERENTHMIVSFQYREKPAQ